MCPKISIPYQTKEKNLFYGKVKANKQEKISGIII